MIYLYNILMITEKNIQHLLTILLWGEEGLRKTPKIISDDFSVLSQLHQIT